MAGEAYDDPYLDWIRTMPCARCNARPARPHHVWTVGAHGAVHVGRCVPLCDDCHSVAHGLGVETTSAAWNLDLRKLAAELGRIWESDPLIKTRIQGRFKESPPPQGERKLGRYLYTFGYSGRTTNEAALVRPVLNAVLVDVRYRPYSKEAGWSRRDLQRLLSRDDYRWLEAFGNVNYKGEEGPQVVLRNPTKGLAVLRSIYEAGENAVLMCACPNYARCHRRDVAELVAGELQLKIKELGRSWWMQNELGI